MWMAVSCKQSPLCVQEQAALDTKQLLTCTGQVTACRGQPIPTALCRSPLHKQHMCTTAPGTMRHTATYTTLQAAEQARNGTLTACGPCRAESPTR